MILGHALRDRLCPRGKNRACLLVVQSHPSRCREEGTPQCFSVCLAAAPSGSPHGSFFSTQRCHSLGHWQECCCFAVWSGLGRARTVCRHPFQGLPNKVSLPISMVQLKHRVWHKALVLRSPKPGIVVKLEMCMSGESWICSAVIKLSFLPLNGNCVVIKLNATWLMVSDGVFVLVTSCPPIPLPRMARKR